MFDITDIIVAFESVLGSFDRPFGLSFGAVLMRLGAIVELTIGWLRGRYRELALLRELAQAKSRPGARPLNHELKSIRPRFRTRLLGSWIDACKPERSARSG